MKNLPFCAVVLTVALSTASDVSAQCSWPGSSHIDGLRQTLENRRYASARRCDVAAPWNMSSDQLLGQSSVDEIAREYGIDYARWIAPAAAVRVLNSLLGYARDTSRSSACRAEARSMVNNARQWAERQVVEACGSRPPYCDTEALNYAMANLRDEIRGDVSSVIGYDPPGSYTLSGGAFNSSCTNARRALITYARTLEAFALGSSDRPYHARSEMGRRRFERDDHGGAVATAAQRAIYELASRVAAQAWADLSPGDRNTLREGAGIPHPARCDPQSSFDRDSDIARRIRDALWNAVVAARRNWPEGRGCVSSGADGLDFQHASP